MLFPPDMRACRRSPETSSGAERTVFSFKNIRSLSRPEYLLEVII